MKIDHEAREQLREIQDGLRHYAVHPPAPTDPLRMGTYFGHFAERIWALLEQTKSEHYPPSPNYTAYVRTLPEFAEGRKAAEDREGRTNPYLHLSDKWNAWQQGWQGGGTL